MRKLCKLKELLVAPPILRVAEPFNPYILLTDASKKSLGTVLNQTTQDGKEHPIPFASKKTPTKRKELLSDRKGTPCHCVGTESILCVFVWSGVLY